jgi:hypothetical protein
MGELQWAVLIVCVALVVALYVFSRRGKRDSDAGDDTGAAGDQQSDLFKAPAGDYDEFGVGRARRRGAAPEMSAPVPPVTPGSPSVAKLLKPLPGQAPTMNPAPRPPVATPPPAAPAAPAAPASTKLVVLIVAPTEETDILGPQLHAALEAQGLRYGEGQVYHRLIGGKIVYSVAGLLKPGTLNPAEAETFSTRGLTVVMHLPGPVKAEVALDDMISTTRALAAALKAEIFSSNRERLTEEQGSALRTEVQDWARAQKAA